MILSKKHINTYHLHKVIRLEYDRYNATQLIQGLQEQGLNVSEFSQAIGTISAPTRVRKASLFR
jgi:phage terminase large subunit-like protein